MALDVTRINEIRARGTMFVTHEILGELCVSAYRCINLASENEALTQRAEKAERERDELMHAPHMSKAAFALQFYLAMARSGELSSYSTERLIAEAHEAYDLAVNNAP